MAWTYDVHNIIIIAPKRYTYEILWTVNNELPWITPASHHTSQLFRNHYAMIIPPCVRYCTAFVLLNIPICAVNSWFTFVRGDGYPSWGIPNYGTERRCFFYGPMTIMIRILYLPDLPRPVWKKPQIVDPHGGNDHQLVAGIGRVPKLGMVESPGKEVGLCLKKHKKHIRYRST